jgi:hypothetical protein
MHPDTQLILAKARQQELLAEARRDRLAHAARSRHSSGRRSTIAPRLRAFAVVAAAAILATRGIDTLGR